MRYFKLLSLTIIGLLIGISCSENEFLPSGVENNLDSQEMNKSTEINSQRTIGNYAPTGAHYNLNIIGVDKGKTADMTNNDGHRMFVNLNGKTKINLSPGDDFQVTDANGTDANGASFTLPDNVSTTYTVWARALGKPGGKVTITTCAELWWEGEFYQEVCSDEPITLVRNKQGAPKFTDVSKNLLFITIYEDVLADDGITVLLDAGTYPLFDPALQGYFWDYDNNGLKLLQLRFYPMN